eukprot:CAMPEP_0206848868 /NCGR_PEP_ID=MMETSP0975-20121206/26230_1 /ASSEMBLY_ACC=CAM_ASM_000399 /TAXON_ID=483370 /ORGANISM="non described non described, Strain CCMP2097" /LENGTH=1097 /DNA_ID=CAMNT_0054391505 /DNA_START=1 /DNA_END=3291 /DNA_ORIENTATION=-
MAGDEDSDVELEGVDMEEEVEEADPEYKDEEEEEAPAKAVKPAKAAKAAGASSSPRKDAAYEEARRAQKERLGNLKQFGTSTTGADGKEQRERRIAYLMAQSEVFAHFMEENSDIGASTKKKAGRTRLTETAEDANLMKTAQSKLRVTRILTQPTSITATMRAYQLEGLNWLVKLHDNGINGILADEMGLGKTLQSISLLAYLHEVRGITGPHIVIVPKSVVNNWIRELKKWCPMLRPVKMLGDREERNRVMRDELVAGQFDVCVTSYEGVLKEKSFLCKTNWQYVLIDEAHRIKNPKSSLSKVVRLIPTQFRLLITGTPLQNNLHELWALLNFLLPDVFASAATFDAAFDLDIVDQSAKQVIITQLHSLLRPFVLRRLKSDVEKSLPPKTETILFTHLSPVQRDVYKHCLLREMGVVQGGGKESGRVAVLNLVMQLRKCCNHPYLFPSVEDRTLPPLGEHLVESCAKLVLLDKLLHRLKKNGHRVLIFSQMTSMLDILEDFLVLRQLKYCRIDGKTPHELREEQIDCFNAVGSDKFAFLLSTRAGGLGINLQTADTCVLYDSDWNPQADLQAMDRCHRIGQTKAVHVYRLVTENSIEEKVVERASQKLKLDAAVVQQGRLADSQRKLATKDLLNAVRFGADKVFRPNTDHEITESDLDAIIARGQEKTAELDKRFDRQEKGDLLDFGLDGGCETQQWEGVDYSDAATRSGMLGKDDDDVGFVLDTGKRERRLRNGGTASYFEKDSSRARFTAQQDEAPNRLPKHLRLPRLEEWMLFDERDRLLELGALEERLFDEAQESAEKKAQLLLDHGPQFASLQLLGASDRSEKLDLLQGGFPDWAKHHYNAFLRASARYGRSDMQSIKTDVQGKSPDQVEDYAKAFWQRGEAVMSQSEWDRATRLIDKGEKRAGEMATLITATQRFVALFPDARRDLRFCIANSAANQLFSTQPARRDEEAWLLALLVEKGYGNWTAIRQALLEAPPFAFDWYIQSLDCDAIAKRCEALMRCAEKELAEMDRRWAALQAAEAAIATARSAVETDASGRPLPQGLRVAKMFEIMKMDHKKQLNLRSTLKAAKLAQSAPAPAPAEAKASRKRP